MRHLPIVMMMLSVAACASREPVAKVPTHDPVFREVTFPPYAPIRLGEPLALRTPRTVALPDGRLRFAEGPFGDADSVYVQLAAGRVAVLTFIYPRSKRVDAALASYDSSLGSGSHAVTDSAGGRLERSVWQDSLTRFEFSRLTSGAGGAGMPRIWSMLVDRAH
jgi:hypothetical protein